MSRSSGFSKLQKQSSLIQDIEEATQNGSRHSFDARSARLVDELAAICRNRDSIITTESLVSLSTFGRARAPRLTLEKSEKEEHRSSKKSERDNARRTAIRRQRLEELNRFFMEGRSNMDISASRVQELLRDDDSDKEDVPQSGSDTDASALLEKDEETCQHPSNQQARVHRELLRDKVDSTVFNPLLSSIREKDPVLYGAILCHPLISGHEHKKEKKKKKKDKDQEKSRSPSGMLQPNFSVETFPIKDIILNISRFLAKAIQDESSQALLLSVLLLLSVNESLETREERQAIQLPIVSHLRLLTGEKEPKFIPIKKVKKATDSMRELKSSSAENGSEIGAKNCQSILNPTNGEESSEQQNFNTTAESEVVCSELELDEEALMAQAIALSLSSESNSLIREANLEGKNSNKEERKIEEVSKSDEEMEVVEDQDDAPLQRCPDLFTSLEIFSLSRVRIPKNAETVDVSTGLLYFTAKIYEHCETYLSNSNKNVLGADSKIVPHPLTFLLISSILGKFNKSSNAHPLSSNWDARMSLFETCIRFTMLRLLEVNLFHLDAMDIPPASVGLGQMSVIVNQDEDGAMDSHNPLPQKLKSLVLDYIGSFNGVSKHVEDKKNSKRITSEHLHPKKDASLDSFNDVVDLYKSRIWLHALAAWTRGVPHFYPRQSDKSQLLTMMLRECLTIRKMNEETTSEVFMQLELLCGRLALPDMIQSMIVFSPYHSGAIKNDNAPQEISISDLEISDDSLLLSAKKNTIIWSPADIKIAIATKALSSNALIQFVKDRQLAYFGINSTANTDLDSLLASYESIWARSKQEKNYEADSSSGVSEILELLMASINDSNWPNFSTKTSFAMAPLFPILRDDGEYSVSVTPMPHALNHRVLLMRSIQDFMLMHLGGSVHDESAPPALEFDATRSAETIALSEMGRVARQQSTKQWGTVMASTGFAPGTGTHEWAVRLDKCEKGHVFLGVCTREASASTYVGGDRLGWGLIGTRALWHNRSKVRGDYGEGFASGATVRVRLNTDTGALSYGIDDNDWGVAFDGLTQCGTLFPAVGLYQRDDQVTLLSVASKSRTEETPLDDSSVVESSTHNQELKLPPVLGPFLRYAANVVEASCRYLTLRSETSQPNPVLSWILPSLFSSLVLLPSSSSLAAIVSLNILPLTAKLVQQLDQLNQSLRASNTSHHANGTFEGLILDVSGKWELKSVAAGNIPAQQYVLEIEQSNNGEIVGKSSGSLSSVTLKGRVRGTKMKFLESWKQGGTCLVEGCLRVDGQAFSGTFEDTKSRTGGAITGRQVQVAAATNSAFKVASNVRNEYIVLEMLSGMLIGKYASNLSNSVTTTRLIKDLRLESIASMRSEPQDVGSSDKATITTEEQVVLPAEASEEDYFKWILSPILMGGLPEKEVQGHLLHVVSRLLDLSKGALNVNSDAYGVISTWIEQMSPSILKNDSTLPARQVGIAKTFASDLISGRGNASVIDNWILKHVGESPFMRVGGDSMKVARRSVVAAMAWHTGCMELLAAHAESRAPSEVFEGHSPTDNSEVRPHGKLMHIWRSSQRVIEWAIRATGSMGVTYPKMASLITRKVHFLLDFKPAMDLTNSDIVAKNASAFQTRDVIEEEGCEERLHSEMLMQLSRFLEAPLQISRLKSIILNNCTRAFFRVLGFGCINSLLSSTKDATFKGLQLSAAIGGIVQWLGPSNSLMDTELLMPLSGVLSQHGGLKTGFGSSYYLDGLGGCGAQLRGDVGACFESLYGVLASSLSRATWTRDTDLQLILLQSWGIVIQPDDHSFLSRVGIFRILQTVLDEARVEVYSANRAPAELKDPDGYASIFDMDVKRRLTQATLKVVHLLAAQVAYAGESDDGNGETLVELPSTYANSCNKVSPLKRRPSGPETLGKSVFNMLFTELCNTLDQLGEETRSSQLNSFKVSVNSEPIEASDPKRMFVDDGTLSSEMGETQLYCFQICSLLYSVSSTAVCRSHLSSNRWIRLMLALVERGNMKIQVKMLRLLRRLLPSVNPSTITLRLDVFDIVSTEIDSDDEMSAKSSTDGESAAALIRFLMDIISGVVPESASRALYQASCCLSEETQMDSTIEAMATTDSPSTKPGFLLNRPYKKCVPLAAEVVSMVRVLHRSEKWAPLLSKVMAELISDMTRSPFSFVEDAASNIEKHRVLVQWKESHLRFGRGLAALCVCGGNIESLRLGGTVKLIPKSNSVSESLFSGAHAVLVSYDQEKSVAEILLSSSSSTDARTKNKSPPTGSKGLMLSPVRVPAEDISAISEIDFDVNELSEDLISAILMEKMSTVLGEIEGVLHSYQESCSKIRDDLVYTNEEQKDESEPALDEETETKEISSETTSQVVHEAVVREEKLNHAVMCLYALQSSSALLQHEKCVQAFMNCQGSRESIRRLLRVAVTETNSNGLSSTNTLKERWLFLWSRWYEISRLKVLSLNRSFEIDEKSDAVNTKESLPSAACQQMMDMGFPREWCEIALKKCGKNVENAINFCFEHSGDMEQLIAEQESGKAAGPQVRPKEVMRNPLLEQLVEMGFPKKWCEKALEVNRNNVDAALTWILSNGESLEAEDRREEEEEEVRRRAEGRESGDAGDPSDATGPELEAGAGAGRRRLRVGPNPLAVVSGQATIGSDLTVEGLSGGGFASVGARKCLVAKGRWYYEATLYTAGCIQLGWADVAFSGASDRGDGVGDNDHSWAYDGWRQQKWHGASSPWGWKWAPGDVVGCALDVDAGVILFSLNGKMKSKAMGVAFEGIQFTGGLYPCASFNRRERLKFNLGGLPFQHAPPKGFRPILESIWKPGEEIAQVDVLQEDCLEEFVGEENYSSESRYFKREPEPSLLRAAGIHFGNGYLIQTLQNQNPGGGSKSDGLQSVTDEQVYPQLLQITQTLSILHARKILLTLLTNWPSSQVGPFSLNFLQSRADDEMIMSQVHDSSVDDDDDDEPGLLIAFVKLVAGMNSNSSNPSSSLRIPSPAEQVDGISLVLDGNVSGKYAMSLLSPILRSAIQHSPTGGSFDTSSLIGCLLSCVSNQISMASERVYSSIPWDGTESSITSCIIEKEGNSDSKWTDHEILRHPNIVLAEWLTILLLESTKTGTILVSNTVMMQNIRLTLFRSWSLSLRSPSMSLKETGYSMISTTLMDLLASTDHSSKEIRLAILKQLVDELPIDRLLDLTEVRIAKEFKSYPICSKYLQSLVELSSTIGLVFSVLEKDLKRSKRDTDQMCQAAKLLEDDLYSIHREEVDLANQATVEFQERSDEVEMAAALGVDVNAGNDASGVTPGDQPDVGPTNGGAVAMEFEESEVAETAITQSPIRNLSVKDRSVSISSDVSSDVSMEERANARSLIRNILSDDRRASFSSDISMEDRANTRSLIRIILNEDRSASLSSDVSSDISMEERTNTRSLLRIMLNEDRNASLLSDVRMKDFTPVEDRGSAKSEILLFPDEVIEFDYEGLEPQYIKMIEAASYGIMGKEEDAWNFGNEAWILSDNGTETWSGVILQHEYREESSTSTHTCNSDSNSTNSSGHSSSSHGSSSSSSSSSSHDSSSSHGSSSPSSSAPALKVGDKVIRGPSWKWRDQDGGEGSIGTVETISPWSGVEGEGMSVRWPNESLYTYRWGADGHYDLVHVECDDVGNVVRTYPIPTQLPKKDTKTTTTKTKKKKGSLGDGELRLGILLHLFPIAEKADFQDMDEDEVDTEKEDILHGLLEWPDYGAASRVIGKRKKNGAMWIQELQLVRGCPDMGWSALCGSEKWIPGTRMHFELESDSMTMSGHHLHPVRRCGKVRQLNCQVKLSRKHLFTLDKHCCSSHCSISEDGLTVTCVGGDSRHLALGTVGFSSGVHYWEVKVDQAEFGSVYIGVCDKPGPPGSPTSGNAAAAAASMTMTSLTAQNSNNSWNRWCGWGFVNFRATYHNSTERIYGDHFNAGDTVGVLLDMDRGKLAFFMDGIKYGEHIVTDLGYAFENLHGDRGDRKTLYPCLGMRKAGDTLTINGKWLSRPGLSPRSILAEALETSMLLNSWLDTTSHEGKVVFSEKILAESWNNWKLWVEGHWRRSVTRANGVAIDFDTSPMSCIAASRRAGLVAPFLAGDRVKICSSGGRELDQPEEAIILGAYRGHIWYRSESQGNEGADEGRARAWYWSDTELIEVMLIKRDGLDMTAIENSSIDITLAEVERKYNAPSHESILSPRELEAMKSFSCFKKLVLNECWSPQADIGLVEGINALCSGVGADAWNVQFGDVTSFGDDSQVSHSMSIEEASPKNRTKSPSTVKQAYFNDESLKDVQTAELRARLSIFRVLNEKLLRILPLIRLQSGGGCSPLIDIVDENVDKNSSLAWNWLSTGQRLRALRTLIFSSTKEHFWNSILTATTTSTPLPSDEYEDPKELRVIRINRIQAQPSKLLLLPQPSDRLRRSVFGQVYREVRSWSDSSFCRSYVGKGHGGQKRMFKVKFLGEGVNDYGGPYRAVFEQIVDELQMDNVELSKGEQGLLPLLIPCPNRRSGTGSNQDKFLLNPSCGASSVVNGPMALDLYRFLGKLIGASVRHGLQMGLDLPSLVWRPLAGLSLGRAHLETVDIVASTSLERLSTSTEDNTLSSDEFEGLAFTTLLSDGTEVPLTQNGANHKVSTENCREYVKLSIQKRLKESKEQLQALRQGMAAVLPMELSPLFTAKELENLICGRREVDVELLKSCTEYEGSVDESSPHIQYFWEVLKEMTEEEKTAFLRFVWARSRMPNSAKDFPMNFKIQSAHDQGAKSNPDDYLPHAQTCFFSLSLPVYTSKEALRKKLIYAINNSPNMDADVRLHNAEGWADA